MQAEQVDGKKACRQRLWKQRQRQCCYLPEAPTAANIGTVPPYEV
jgi:hypothetical protein